MIELLSACGSGTTAVPAVWRSMVLSLRMTEFGGAEEDRTPDLRIANATLSQLSYGPIVWIVKDPNDTTYSLKIECPFASDTSM
jgi:hypothetical protein